VTLSLDYACYFIAHWLFSFRYFEVAEMLGRADKSNEAHLRARSITGKVTIGAIIFILLRAVILIVDKFFFFYYPELYLEELDFWILFVLPNFIMFVECLLLLIALVWIFKSLKHDKHVMGNEKWMLLHTILLILTFGSQLYTGYTYQELRNAIKSGDPSRIEEALIDYDISLQIFMILQSIVTVIMVLIMNQVNSP